MGPAPVFKTNVKTFVSLRKATPPISLEDLQALARHFPAPGYRFPLDPSFEPERSSDEPNNSGILRRIPQKPRFSPSSKGM